MSRTLPLSLPDTLADYVEAEVRAGRFGSSAEVVGAALQLLKRQGERDRALEAALIEGEQSGAPVAFDVERFIERKIQHRR